MTNLGANNNINIVAREKWNLPSCTQPVNPKGEKKMRTLSLLAGGGFVLTLMACPAGLAQTASDLEALRIEIKQMREQYESQISQLQTEVRELKQSRDLGVSQPAGTADQKGDKAGEPVIKYVGRQEGPFQKGGLLLKNPSGFGQVSVGGYADIELENFQKAHSTFDQHRWIINIGAELGERLKFYSEYEIEHGGPDASGGGEAHVEQAWMDYLIHEMINLRAGALLVPFGRYNLYHDSDLQDLTDRPILARRVIPTTWTESGAGLHGRFNPRIGSYEDLEIGYEMYFINGFNSAFSDTGLRGARGSIESDNNNAKSLVGRIVASPAIGHELGLSGYWGDYNGEDDDLKGLGIDFLTTWGPWEFLGEWALFSADDSAAGDVADTLQGMYLQANYHFWFDFLNNTFLGKSFENPTFTLVGRFDWAEIDDDSDTAVNLANREGRWTLGINYRPVESWVLKLEYQNNFNRGETLERGDKEGFIASIAMGF